ncbi:methyltransferase domain-containing protein [Candidatus Saccharibacteria bacterium]|jgi:predicted TPR repeat methyltransferase|nr:methyltransferase domain-containing protein [Candidatus Saccharibacteria bacterium]
MEFLSGHEDMSNNDRTLATYERRAAEYVEGTQHEVSGAFKEWLDATIENLSTDARILEIGSAFGRDADYLEGKGYSVECTDATQAFVDLLNKANFGARKLNVIKDEIDGNYDLILANAVFLHFTREELAGVLGKTHAALNEGGRLGFTIAEGDGEEWSDRKVGEMRYFCRWRKDELANELNAAGFANIDIVNSEGWLHVIADK